MPVVEEALIEMVKAAEGENVFKYKKRNKFNGCDFLTEYLFNKNPKRNSSKNVPLDEIPFCQDFNKKFPRKQLPLSLRFFKYIFFYDRRVVFSAEKHLRTINCCERLNYFRLTEDEASTLIQAWWRGVKTRRRPEIRELIEYQKQLRHKKSS